MYIDDALLLQCDLDQVQQWCTKNALSLNITKCSVITFTWKRVDVVDYDYQIDSEILARNDVVIDLGVSFDSNLNFGRHISSITKKALRVGGFVQRNTHDFSDTNAFITLYKTLFRPILEYCSVIWTPDDAAWINLLEKPHHKFLRYMSYNIGSPMSPGSRLFSHVACTYGHFTEK